MSIEEIFFHFRKSYLEAARENGLPIDQAEQNIGTLYKLAKKEALSPTPFEAFHERITSPFDYYRFGIDFFGPLIKMNESSVLGKERLLEIENFLAKGENVVLLANHQTEPDPQIISALLEKEHPRLAEEMIFVAGHRVVSDPVAIPFSLGRNLICIHSKKYIEHPPEEREAKTLHNRRALEQLKLQLKKGGKCVYVAPSGGRDRAQEDGSVNISPFDSGSLELFRLVAKDTLTHFYPFAMKTYYLMPPPSGVQHALGEKREANAVPVHIAFGQELDMENFPHAPEDKHAKREARADYIFNQVLSEYKKIDSL